MLLLFTIGLKFDIRALMRKEAWGTAAAHMILASLVGAGFVGLLAVVGLSQLGGDWGTLALMGFALSFSSTVLCVKVLEERSDDGAYYGQTAIAILVFQDLAAVVFITATGEDLPSPWAFALVLLPVVTLLLGKLLDRVGRGELLVLFGVALALGPGYSLFSSLGIKGDLDALAVGLLLAGHARSGELAKSMFSVKELFLVGFFLSIGMGSELQWLDVGIGLLLCLVLLPLKTAGFVLLSRALGLRNRTAVMSGLVLGNFSEFALIVAVVGVSSGLLSEQNLGIIAVAVALSMVISSVVNGRGLRLVDAIASRLPDQQLQRITPADRPISTSDAQVVVLGLGRVGRAAYERLREQGLRVTGVDNDHALIERLRGEGFDVLEGDATDQAFWDRLSHTGDVELVVLSMPEHDSNAFALDQLEAAGFGGRVAAVAQYADEARALEARGVGTVFNLYQGAGIALADGARRELDQGR